MSEELFNKLVEKFAGKSSVVEELIIGKIDESDGLIDRDTAIEVLATEHAIPIPQSGGPQEIKIKPIGELTEEDLGLWFSVKAFVKDIYPITKFTRNDGTAGKVCNAVLLERGATITLSCWGEFAEEIQGFMHKPVLLRSVQYQKNTYTPRGSTEEVVEFRLSTGRYSQMIAVPSGQQKLAK